MKLFFILWLATMTIVYLCGGFVHMDMNPAHWEMGDRACMVFFGVLATIGDLILAGILSEV